MARHWFLGDVASWSVALGADETSTSNQSGKRALLIPGAVLTFWSAATGGTQYTDLMDGIGTPITSVTADSAGQLPEIQGPDTIPDTWVMYADGNNGAGPRRKVVATDLPVTVSSQGDTIAGLVTSTDANTTAVTAIQDSIGAPNGLATLDGGGKVPVTEVPDLDAAKVVSGTLGTARIPGLDASKVTSGTFGTPQIPNLDASKITSGMLNPARIPDLTGTFIPLVQKAASSGVASLDANSKVVQGVSANNVDGLPVPKAWSAFGHSYMASSSGGMWTTSRLDAMFRTMIGVQPGDFRNYAVWGAAINQDTRQPGGWTRVMQELTHQTAFNSNVHGAPYWPDGGGYLFCYGINDLGFTPSVTQAQIRATFQNTLRALICRARTSVIWEDNYVPVAGTDGQPVYGTGFTQTANTSEFSSGTTLRDATATGTNSKITLTLPADYAGEPVVIQFIANAGATNGTVTFSGTAGVTGTFAIANALTNVKVPVVKRITGLTSAKAGTTIIITVTALDAGGSVRFDYWGLEAKTAPPVIVCNAARVLSSGYATYSNSIGDSDITALNTAIASVVAEFDGMVQLADIDTAIGKDAANFGADGLHPNELGAALAASAIVRAVRALVPSDNTYRFVNVASYDMSGALRRPRIQSQYYTAEYATALTGQTLVAGDMYAIPFLVPDHRGMYIRPSIQVTAATTNTSALRWGLYDDVDWKGYPQCLVTEFTSGGVFTLTASAGLKQNTGITVHPNFGLYWFVVNLTAVGTGMTFQVMSGPDMTGIMPRLGSTFGAQTMAINTTPIAWKLTGQPTTALPPVFPAGASVTGTAPMVALWKA